LLDFIMNSFYVIFGIYFRAISMHTLITKVPVIHIVDDVEKSKNTGLIQYDVFVEIDRRRKKTFSEKSFLIV